MTIKIEIIHMEPEFTNSVLISNNESAVIFDPWGRGEDWIKLLIQRKLKLHSIFCTHGHYDHFSAIPGIGKIKWYLHPSDNEIVLKCNYLLPEMGMESLDINKTPPSEIKPGEIEIMPGLFATAIHCPGHSPGGMAFYFKPENTLIIGDTLFQESIGRYDFPGGNLQQLTESIAKIYNMNLPDNTTVIHGHGPETNIGWLKRNNRFFNK
jgi:glyoxylase-like metal-dependent hydrolase (beta-lactamase superfamily II)